MYLNIVTSDELLVSLVVKIILTVILAGGVAINLRRIIGQASVSEKAGRGLLLTVLTIIGFFVVRASVLDRALLQKPYYTEGITVGYCNVFTLGQGIAFEYTVNGKRVTNCNTYHPISKEQIKVPGGKYSVRYAIEFPDEGRMDFSHELK